MSDIFRNFAVVLVVRGANETMVVHIGDDVDAGGKLAGRMHADGLQG